MKKSLGFKAVAVVAATDRLGNICGYHSTEKSISTEDFVVFLEDVRRRSPGPRRIFMVVDNLGVHYTKVVRRAAVE